MPRSRLHDKVVLVTGASAGIGRAVALEFARTCPQSLKLILTARRLEPLHQLSQQIAQECGPGVQVHVASLDVGDRPAVDHLISTLPPAFTPIDILINNAGLARGRAQAPDIDEADLNLTYATNFHGVVNLTQAVLPAMLARRSPDAPAADSRMGYGDVVTIGSVAGRDAYPGGSIYCSSKSAVDSFVDALRRELISTRTRVMMVVPGQVKTEFTVHRNYGDVESARAFYAGQESLTAEDCAEVVVWCCGRRENVVCADVLVLPSHQGRADLLWKRPGG